MYEEMMQQTFPKLYTVHQHDALLKYADYYVAVDKSINFKWQWKCLYSGKTEKPCLWWSLVEHQDW